MADSKDTKSPSATSTADVRDAAFSSYGYDNPFLTFAKFVRTRFNDYVLEHAKTFATSEYPDSPIANQWRSNFPTITFEKGGALGVDGTTAYHAAPERSNWALQDLFKDEYNHRIYTGPVAGTLDRNSGFVGYLDEDETYVSPPVDGYEYSEGEDLRATRVDGLYVEKVSLKLPNGPDGRPAVSWEDRGLDYYEAKGVVGGAYIYSECDPFQDFKRLLISIREDLSLTTGVWWHSYYGVSDNWNRTPFSIKYPIMTTRNPSPGEDPHAPGFFGIPDEAMGISAGPPHVYPPSPGPNNQLDSKQLNGLIRSAYYLYLAINSEESLEDPVWTQYYLAEFLLAFTNMGSLEPHFNDYLCVPTIDVRDPGAGGAGGAAGGGGAAAGTAFDPFDERWKTWNRKSESANVQKFVGALPLLGADVVGSLDELSLDAEASGWPEFTRAEYNTPIFDYVNDLLGPAEEEHPGIYWSMLQYLNAQTPEDSEWPAGVDFFPDMATAKYDPLVEIPGEASPYFNPGQSHIENSVKWSLEAWMSYFLSERTVGLSPSLYSSLLESYFSDDPDSTTAETWELDEEGDMFGLPGDEYGELLEQGLVLKPCDPPAEPFIPEECPPCIPNPEAFVPNWRENEDGVVFSNQRSCEYCVTTVSGETDATIVNDEVTREAFLDAEKERGIDLILQNFEKYPVNEETRNIIREYSVVKEYDIPLRPLLPLRALVCVDVNVINAIELLNPAEEEIVPPPVEPIGCVLMAQEIRTMIKKANEAFRYYGHKYSLWSHETGLTIQNFDPDEERRKLRIFVPVLVTLMGRNGFKLNGKGAA